MTELTSIRFILHEGYGLANGVPKWLTADDLVGLYGLSAVAKICFKPEAAQAPFQSIFSYIFSDSKKTSYLPSDVHLHPTEDGVYKVDADVLNRASDYVYAMDFAAWLKRAEQEARYECNAMAVKSMNEIRNLYAGPSLYLSTLDPLGRIDGTTMIGAMRFHGQLDLSDHPEITKINERLSVLDTTYSKVSARTAAIIVALSGLAYLAICIYFGAD